MRGVLLLSTVAYKAYSLASPDKSHNNFGNKAFSPTQSKKGLCFVFFFLLPTLLKVKFILFTRLNSLVGLEKKKGEESWKCG